MTDRTSQRKGCTVHACKRRPARLGLCNTHLLRRADEAFSRYVRQRDGRCVVCKSTARLQCAHIISRRYRGTRWNPANAVCLCASCHVYYEHRPLEWQEWAGQDWDVLRRMALDFDGDWKDMAEPWLDSTTGSG